MAPSDTDIRVVAKNRRARFDYELGDKFEAGLVLSGSEVRSLRENGGDVTGAWVDIDSRGEVWVKDMRIPALKHAFEGHEEKRRRKLLLHRAEVERLRGRVEREGMTLVATQVHFRNNRAKLEFCVARGKKKHDKRQTVRERDAEREARVAMRRGKQR